MFTINKKLLALKIGEINTGEFFKKYSLEGLKLHSYISFIKNITRENDYLTSLIDVEMKISNIATDYGFNFSEYFFFRDIVFTGDINKALENYKNRIDFYINNLTDIIELEKIHNDKRFVFSEELNETFQYKLKKIIDKYSEKEKLIEKWIIEFMNNKNIDIFKKI